MFVQINVNRVGSFTLNQWKKQQQQKKTTKKTDENNSTSVEEEVRPAFVELRY